MKKLGDAGLLGINKPVEFGGLGLDYKYQGKKSFNLLPLPRNWHYVCGELMEEISSTG